MKWKGQILSGAIITGFMRWMEKKQSSIGILFRRLFTKKYSFEDIADKTFIKMHSMTIREELARQAGGRSMKTAITLMWNLSCIPSLG